MLVLSGRAFYHGRIEPLSLGIDDGRIVAIKKALKGEKVLDFGDALILPGGIDLHVHLRDPGDTHKEDFASGTRSAALGGITTVLDMPNTRPPVTTPDALKGKMALARGRANVDFGLYAAPRSAGGVASLLEATAFKAYLAETPGGLKVDEEALAEILPLAGEVEKLVAVHAEDARKFAQKKASTLEAHHIARPKESEVSAVRSLDALRGSARLHIAHVTCVDALEAVPPGATTEVTPHHLLLDVSRPIGAFGKVNPPLRRPEDREALWKSFAEGRVDVLASDHAPHTREEKETAFDEAPAGIPGVGTSLPLLLRKVKAGDLALERLVAAAAARPAEILGLSKGEIDVGQDADLLIVDPRRCERITAKRVRAKCDWTPFGGLEGCFPLAVFVRGEAVVEGGEPSAEGIGRAITISKR